MIYLKNTRNENEKNNIHYIDAIKKICTTNILNYLKGL